MADGAEIETSPELYLDALIRKYGVYGVLGRPLSGNEIRCIDLALKAQTYYYEMTNALSWATWTAENPGKASFLLELLQLKAEWGYG